MTKQENKLGRGLSSLIRKEDFDELLEKPSGSNIIFAKLGDITPNANQPRKHFDKETLEELTTSIKKNGVISPILVRKKPDGKFEIIAGERRYRAAKLAELELVPVLLKEVTDTQVLELSIIENVQRDDLNIIEEAKAYQDLIENYSYNQNDISITVGKSRSHIANILRLLSLPEDVTQLLREDKITMGHAKILIGREDASQLADRIIKNSLNVRQAEALTKRSQALNTPDFTGNNLPNIKATSTQKDEDIQMLETLLKEKSDLNVKIDNIRKLVTIRYDDLSELDKILQLLSSK
jgi:ParB family chromosome partitioning protein